MISASTVFVLRLNKPDATAYRAWGYPIVPASFIISAAVLLYFTFTENLCNSPSEVMRILTGLPMHFYFASHKCSQSHATLCLE